MQLVVLCLSVLQFAVENITILCFKQEKLLQNNKAKPVIGQTWVMFEKSKP